MKRIKPEGIKEEVWSVLSDLSVPVKVRRRVLLEDVLEFYGEDTSRRALVDTPEGGNCAYNTPCGKKCAIGRYLGEVPEKFNEKGISHVLMEDEPGVVPYQLRELGGQFLFRVQYLHDNGGHWEKTGLSYAGVEEVRNIADSYLTEEN